jgi:O-acetylhomoserine/O-acetylserine sulfhydrylase-like pyridoxal-dependent enzyme
MQNLLPVILQVRHIDNYPKKELKAAGVPEDLVRLSIGLENIDDIIEDLDKSLKASQK